MSGKPAPKKGICSRCGTADPSKFTPSALKKSGSYCRQCHAEYRRQPTYGVRRSSKYQDAERVRRVDWLRNEKSKAGCQRCGERDAACLDFHHVDESQKKISIATAIHQLSKAKIEKEIEKTIVLCSNCHRKLHFYEKSGTFARVGKGLPRPKRE